MKGRETAQLAITLLLAAFALLGAFYATCVGAGVLPFNSGAWVVGEEVALRGWPGYLLSAILHFAAAVGLWRQRSWGRWLAILVLGFGLLPAIPGISAAVVDMRIAGILLWGSLIMLRTAALYLLMNTD